MKVAFVLLGFVVAAWALSAQTAYATLVFPNKQSATSRIVVAGSGEFGLSPLDKRTIAQMTEITSYVMRLPLTGLSQVSFLVPEPSLRPPAAAFRPNRVYQWLPEGWKETNDFPPNYAASEVGYVRVNEFELAAYGFRGLPFRMVRLSDGVEKARVDDPRDGGYRWIEVPPGVYGLYIADRQGIYVNDALVQPDYPGKPVPWEVEAGHLYQVNTHSGGNWKLILDDVPEFTLVNK